MKEFIEYLDNSFPDEKGNRIMFEFKRDLLSQMNERYLEVSSRGVENKKAFCDLIISEHKDLEGEYQAYYKKATAGKKRKNMIIGNIIGSVAFILALIVSYLFVSFTTKDWAHSWVIIVDGILVWVAYLLSLGVIAISKLKRIFGVFARILLGVAIMTLSVAAFIFAMAILHISAAWTIVLFGIITMLIADLVYIKARKHKLAIVNFLLYIPVIFTMLFIVVCYLGIVAWNVGWLLIILGLVIDLAVVIGELMESKHFEKEMKKSWQEN